MFKGTESVNSSDPPNKDGKARFTTKPLKALSDNHELEINVYNFEKYLFTILVFLQKLLAHFSSRETS